MGINQRGLNTPASDAEDQAYVRGNWYSMARGTVAAGTAGTTGNIRMHPFQLRSGVTIAQLGGRVTTLAASGACQLAVYSANRDNFAPMQPLITTADIAVTSAVAVAGPPVNGPTRLERGIYWFGLNYNAAAGGVALMQIIANSQSEFGWLIGDATQNNIASAAAVATFIRTYTAAYGTWPDLTGATPASNAPSNSYGLGQFQVAA